VDATHHWFHNSISNQGPRPAAFHGAAGRVVPLHQAGLRIALGLALCLTSTAGAQTGTGDTGSDTRVPVQYSELKDSAEVVFKSAADSLEWERERAVARRASGLRVVVSLRERHVWVMRGEDTLRTAKAAVASGMTINFAGRSWTFRTPRGKHTVVRKIRNPVWRPPDWLYAETAMQYNLELARLNPNRPVRVGADTLLVVRNGLVGLLDRKAGRFAPLPTDEHIVFNDTLYIPPFGTQNRKIEGELGQFALDLGDGYLLHGTSDPRSIGKAVTHGCIRLGDMDLNWLYVYVPTGTPVYIY
jgi:L,D-transpeptidase-like protein